MNQLQKKIYDRFVRYVSIDTTSHGASQTVPTTDTQLAFGKTLAAEMKEIGFSNVEIDKNGFVFGEIPANVSGAPSIGFLAHMDTVEDYCGKNIRPVLHENYQGGDLVINQAKNMILSVKSAPSLLKCIGHDLVTADGNTLLGGDDKIGIALIMTLGEYLLAHPEVKHGPVKVSFTIDEETGTGITHFDLERFKADFAYTVDGADLEKIDCGNFNADSFVIEIEGKNCHPGSAKDFMANPVRIGSDIVSSWPEDRLPETTEGEQGFILFLNMQAQLDKATLKGIIRHHDLAQFEQFKKDLADLVAAKQAKYPNAKIHLSITKQYRNMREVLKEKPQAMQVLEAALKAEKIDYSLIQARGGTDGAQLSLRGLPTPNIFASYENPHGPYEWLSLGWSEKVFHLMLRILEVAAK